MSQEMKRRIIYISTLHTAKKFCFTKLFFKNEDSNQMNGYPDLLKIHSTCFQSLWPFLQAFKNVFLYNGKYIASAHPHS